MSYLGRRDYSRPLCSHCGRTSDCFVSTSGTRVCTHCGERRDLPAGAPEYKRDKKLREFAREAAQEEMNALRARMSAIERKMDSLANREIKRQGEEVKAERYEAWMGGVLSQIPYKALVRELAKRAELP